ncbi:MAG: hypothetical protein LUD72_01005 [Bacteroidales bacterium]|nr:hypothetical protein [Bacteroidales bacterium]
MADTSKPLTESAVLDFVTRMDMEESLQTQEELSTLSSAEGIPEDEFEELLEKYRAFAEFRR